jgi:cation transport ATPase
MVGERAYFDFSAVDVIAFDDTEIFGVEDVNLKRFMLYGDRDNIEKAMRQMYSLFSVVGGPLYKIFAKALDNRVRHAPATAVSIEADGVCGNLSSKVIAAGTEEYMRRHGIAVPEGSKQEFGIDTTKVMYAAEDGEVYAKFYIRYSFSEEFTMLLPELKREHIVPLIYTSDPNLSNDLLKTLTAGSDCMRVVKKLEPGSDNEKIYRRVSAGVVTYGDKINAINTILLARKHRDFSERVAITELYAISLAAAAGIILSVLGVTLPSIVYGLWHVAWCFALSLSSKRAFLVEKKDNK